MNVVKVYSTVGEGTRIRMIKRIQNQNTEIR